MINRKEALELYFETPCATRPPSGSHDMQKIRYLDKLVDELAKGRSMDKILRK